jgi:hypothetical protein
MLSLSEKADNPCNDTRSLPTKILPMHCYIAISNAPPGHRSLPFLMLVIEQASMLFSLVKWCHSEGGQKSAIICIVIKGDFCPPPANSAGRRSRACIGEIHLVND